MVVLGAMYALSLFAGLLGGWSYEEQDREHPGAGPSPTHPLGTDDLGRDRSARLMHGTRTSLLLATAATLLATAIAAAAGTSAGYLGGLAQRAIFFVVDTVSATPWFFALLLARAMLPLNVGAGVSVAITFLLLGLLGWPPAVRLIAARTAAARNSVFHLQAEAAGCAPRRWAMVQLTAYMRPVLGANFWATLPVFILAEANLSLLGLGVAEPLPSLGNLMSDLRDPQLVLTRPWLLAPAMLLIAVVGSLQILSRGVRSSYDFV